MRDKRKTVLVVGGSSGIGRATAIRFAREGWRVAVSGSNSKKANQVKEELSGDNHLALRMDIASNENVQIGAMELELNFGHVDTLVDSAGVSEANSIIESDFKAWNHQFDLMFYGAVHLARPAPGLPHARSSAPAAPCARSRCMNTLNSLSKKSGAKQCKHE